MASAGSGTRSGRTGTRSDFGVDQQSEYDSYLGPIAAYLRTGADLASLARLLDGFTGLNMGLGSSPSENRRSAQALLDWYQNQIANIGHVG